MKKALGELRDKVLKLRKGGWLLFESSSGASSSIRNRELHSFPKDNGGVLTKGRQGL